MRTLPNRFVTICVWGPYSAKHALVGKIQYIFLLSLLGFSMQYRQPVRRKKFKSERLNSVYFFLFSNYNTGVLT